MTEGRWFIFDCLIFCFLHGLLVLDLRDVLTLHIHIVVSVCLGLEVRHLATIYTAIDVVS